MDKINRKTWNKAYVIVELPKKEKIIFHLTEFEATIDSKFPKIDSDKIRKFPTNKIQKIKGKFDMIELKTKKWWEFWK